MIDAVSPMARTNAGMQMRKNGFCVSTSGELTDILKKKVAK
jgi:hypothetical protein